MIVARTHGELEKGLIRLRGSGRTLGLVPTMGYLHEGHLSLVDVAAAHADAVAASIFVNPLQFGPSEDLDAYPRDENRDLALLEARGTALAFAPTTGEMYPGGAPRVTVDPGPMGDVLCGAHRPGHFRGVLTVVAKLLGLFRPDVAVFGRKDFQQAVLIRRMVQDLDIPVRIVTAPIVREPDGLALSSRNTYLSAEERTQAVGLFEALQTAREAFATGERAPQALLSRVRDTLARRPLLRLQYAQVVDPSSLEPVEEASADTVLALAAFCGRTRLIDNTELGSR